MAGCYLAGETGLRAARLPLLTPTRALTEQSERRVGRASLVPATSRGSACARSSCCEGILWEGRSLWARCGGRGDRGAVGEDSQETEGDVQDLLGAPRSFLGELPARPTQNSPPSALLQTFLPPLSLPFLSPYPSFSNSVMNII